MPASDGQQKLSSQNPERQWYSLHPCVGPGKGRHKGLGGLPGGAPCCRNTCGAVARSLKMNMDGAACLDAGMGRCCPMWTLSHDVGAISGGRGKEFPPVTAGENHTLVQLMKLASPPSKHCKSPTGPTVELSPNVHRHGT